jgi:hypothetical protein
VSSARLPDEDMPDVAGARESASVSASESVVGSASAVGPPPHLTPEIATAATAASRRGSALVRLADVLRIYSLT